ncbi:MAG: DUF1574 family protein [Leptonema sp. (in: bacteria)]
MFSKKPFFIPFFLFFMAFLVDKLILLDSFPLYYLTTASFINFEHKEKLTLELKEYLLAPNRKKVLVILGNSRSMSFSNEYISKKYPEWILFNFSVPGGTQDYFLYIMEKFKKENIQPNAIVFVVTPQGMNLKPAVKTDEVMIFGLPFDFVLRHFSDFSIDQLTNYLGKKLFAIYKYKPKIHIIIRRSNEWEMLKFTSFLIKNQMILEQERGSVKENENQVLFFSQEIIEKNAESIWNDFYTPFILDKKAILFLEDCIKIAKELKVPHIALLWAPVSPSLKKRKEEKKVAFYKVKDNIALTVKEIFIKEMEMLIQKHNVHWYDFNFSEPMQCNYFFDASHLSYHCLNEYTDKIFQKLKN